MLVYHISLWQGSCRVHDRNALQRVMHTVYNIIEGDSLPSIDELVERRSLWRVIHILEDILHPNNDLYTLLPSDRF